jgi:hypothetical protein
MARPYSRLASVEERKNIKSAIIFVLLTIGALALLFFVGLPLLGNFAAFVSDVGKGNKPIAITDKTPPAPPKFNTFADFTNQNQIELSGNSEPGATVKLTFNGNVQDSLADKDGKFIFNLTLTNGDNPFSAIAVDPAGNVSQKTDDYKITFDNKPPDLTIESPADGAQFLGTKQRQVTIQGTSEANTQITINDRIVAIDDSGKFQYTSTLNDGENKFVIKSTDQAGNVTEKDLTLSFTS